MPGSATSVSLLVPSFCPSHSDWLLLSNPQYMCSKHLVILFIMAYNSLFARWFDNICLPYGL